MPKIRIIAYPKNWIYEGQWEIQDDVFGEVTGGDGVSAEFKISAHSAHKGPLVMYLFGPRGDIKREDFSYNGVNLTVRLVPVEPGNEGRVESDDDSVQTMKISKALYSFGSRIQFILRGDWPNTNRVSARLENASDDTYRVFATGNGFARILCGVHVE